MAISIASVTIAYNARALLARQLEALIGQNLPLREIIVVDNASADDTAVFVASQYPQVKLIRLSENQGVGGGYAAGLIYGVYEKKYDWIWMLDQDSIPQPETLSTLIETWITADCRDQIGIIAPLSLKEDARVPYSMFMWRSKQVEVSPADLESPLCFVDMVISSGSLISNKAVRVAGLPRSDFFIDFVDFEHCLRLRRHGFKICVATQSTMAHTIGRPRSVLLLGKAHPWITHVAWREYYKVRNRAFVVWHEVPSAKAKWFVLRKFARQAIGTLLFDGEKLQRLKFMCRGLWDGIRGRLGRQVLPEG